MTVATPGLGRLLPRADTAGSFLRGRRNTWYFASSFGIVKQHSSLRTGAQAAATAAESCLLYGKSWASCNSPLSLTGHRPQASSGVAASRIRYLHVQSDAFPNEPKQKQPPQHPGWHRTPTVCIVGSGPSGFYCAKSLLRLARTQLQNENHHAQLEHNKLEVVIIDALPAPYGLARYGVAADKPEVKAVINQFKLIAESPGVSFRGNVTLGRDVSLTDLRRHFDAVVLSMGAAAGASMQVDGAHLAGVCTARDLVFWFNGHPELRGMDRRLGNGHSRQAVVVGHGNVALDVGRILLKAAKGPIPVSTVAAPAPPADTAAKSEGAVQQPSTAGGAPQELHSPVVLSLTDVDAAACAWARGRGFDFVRIIGRRGAAQASFTNKELRELLKEDSLLAVIDPQELNESFTEASRAEIKESRAKQRAQQLYAEMAKNWPRRHTSGLPVLQLSFCRSPKRILPCSRDPASIGSVVLQRNALVGPPNGQRAVPVEQQQQTGDLVAATEEQPASLVVWSVGFTIDTLPRLANAPESLAAGGDGSELEELLPASLPTDARGLLRHTNGQVLPPQSVAAAAEGGQATKNLGGLYVCGWFKHGPRGTIADAVLDAQQTAQQIFADLTSHQQQAQKEQNLSGLPTSVSDTGDRPASHQDDPGVQGGSSHEATGIKALDAILRSRKVRFVTFSGWERIAENERRRGREQGRSACKVTSIEEMLQLADA